LIRHRIAVIVILTAAVLTVFNVLLEVPGLRASGYGVDTLPAEIAPALPPTGVVGYWSDIEGTPEAEAQVQREYYLIQYALAPRVVVRSLEQEFVIVHAHPDEKRFPRSGMRGANLEMVQDFGHGLKVFRKRAR
jgi:hypothetical protein